jgi:hypothetical protein
MSQHDYVISNDDGASIRADINDLAAAVKSGNSHASTAPSSPVAGMVWVKTVSATVEEHYVYDGTSWVLVFTVNPTAHAVIFAQSGRPRFSAHKNGSDQGSIATATDTKITFGTEDYDVGGFYNAATSVWTPPPGDHMLVSTISWSAGIADQQSHQVRVYKNGGLHRIEQRTSSGTTALASSIAVQVVADGDDTFEIYGRASGAGDKTVEGDSNQTWFQGFML